MKLYSNRGRFVVSNGQEKGEYAFARQVSNGYGWIKIPSKVRICESIWMLLIMRFSGRFSIKKVIFCCDRIPVKFGRIVRFLLRSAMSMERRGCWHSHWFLSLVDAGRSSSYVICFWCERKLEIRPDLLCHHFNQLGRGRVRISLSGHSST